MCEDFLSLSNYSGVTHFPYPSEGCFSKAQVVIITRGLCGSIGIVQS